MSFSKCLALTLVLTGAACGSGSTLPLAPGSNTNVERNGAISGTVVVYGTTKPVAGVGVKVAGAVAVTDSAGKFSVANIPSSGTAVLTADASNLSMQFREAFGLVVDGNDDRQHAASTDSRGNPRR